MKANKLGFKEAADEEQKRGASINARMTNIANKSFHTEKDLLRGERMKLALEILYNAETVFINYRKQMITVKVSKPCKVSNKQELTLMENNWEKQGVTKIETAQGISYRIKTK